MKLFTTLLVLLVATACTSKDDTSAVDAGAAAASPCTKDSDCTQPGYACGYLIADGCGATGQCAKSDGAGCNAVAVCACDGTATTGCRFVPGDAGAYAPKPVRALGKCEADASTDGATE